MSRLSSTLACLTLGLAITSPAASATPAGPSSGHPDLVAVPAPRLEGIEGSIREALENQRHNLDALIEGPASDADLAEAYGRLGRLYQSYGIAAAALACYRNAGRLAPRDYRWPYLLGYLKGNEAPREAIRLYQEALRLRPSYPPTRIHLAMLYLETGDLARAGRLLRDATRHPETAALAWAELGQLAALEGHYEEAVEHYREALARDPQATLLHYRLAMAYRALGRVGKARAELAQRGTQAPRLADPLIDTLADLGALSTRYFHAMQAVRGGQYVEAVEHFRQALAEDPKNWNARVSLARAEYLKGEPKTAERSLREVVDAAPGNALAHFLLGALLLERGQKPEAVSELRETLRIEPGHPGAEHFLGDAAMRAGDYTAATRHYAAALHGMPENDQARRMHALALLRSGAPAAQVREALEAALQRLPGEPQLSYWLARLLATTSDAEVRDGTRALRIARGLFQREPGPRNAELLAMALAESGDYALAAAQQANTIAAVGEGGLFDLLPRLEEWLERYERREPCRHPWWGDEPDFRPPAQDAELVFRSYPSKTPY